MWGFLLEMHWNCLYPKHSTMNCKQLMYQVRETQDIRDSTFKCWWQAIRPIAEQNISLIDKLFVTNYWKSQLKPVGNCSPETLRRRLSLLSGIWNMAIEEEIISTHNFWYRSSKKIKVDRNLEAERLGKEYPVRPYEFYKKYHNDPIFLAIWFHGFRVGEIAGLRNREIIFNNNIPYFQIKDNDIRLIKRGARRDVPIHPEFYPWIGELTTDETRFPGKNWSQKFHEQMELPIGEAAHSLRHNFITRARTALPDQDSMISKLVGHRIQGMTARYGTWTMEDKLKAISKIRR
jgi:integrase